MGSSSRHSYCCLPTVPSSQHSSIPLHHPAFPPKSPPPYTALNLPASSLTLFTPLSARLSEFPIFGRWNRHHGSPIVSLSSRQQSCGAAAPVWNEHETVHPKWVRSVGITPASTEKACGATSVLSQNALKPQIL